MVENQEKRANKNSFTHNHTHKLQLQVAKKSGNKN